uniref:Uncharacterized protein n=2 Tax=Avena sativa TaxID=4498 RepID=A0ACD5ZGE6_AVESA
MHLRLLRAKALFRRTTCGRTTFSTAQPKVVTVGIDFGCKNSRVAIIDDSLVPELVDSESGRSTPSYVTSIPPEVSEGWYAWALQRLEGHGKHVAVGELAKCRMSRQPSDVVFNIKKLIGKQFDDFSVQEMRKRVHFGIIKGERGEACVEISGMDFSPVEIASVIFAKLKDAVLMYQFHHELKAVISVPIFFSKQQREDIMLAGNKAGLTVLQLIDEPTAAALSRATMQESTVVVFDMGAGAYTVSVFHVSGTNIEVKSQFSDPCMGGDHFDDILLDYFVTQITNSHGVDVRGDKYAMMLLAEATEQAKVELSTEHEVTISTPFIISSSECSGDGPSVSISRAEFERLVLKLVEQIRDQCWTLLKEANITGKDVDEVVLTGGMTRVPMIRGIIHEIFGKHQGTRVNHEEAVVIGSAIQAALIVEDQRELTEHMTALSIGIESEGVFMRVIPRHTAIPTKRAVKIPAWCAYGERLNLKIFLGEHVMVSHNTFLGEVELVNNLRSGQGSVHFELTFEVDTDYVVKVTGRNPGDADNGRKAAVKVFPVREIMMSKGKVDEAIREGLLGWSMQGIETHARLVNMGRHIANTLSDVLSARKDQVLEELAERKDDDVPKDLCGNAERALADLLAALDSAVGEDAAHIHVLKDKMLAAANAEQKMMLNWKQPPKTPQYGYYSDYSDYEHDSA